MRSANGDSYMRTRQPNCRIITLSQLEPTFTVHLPSGPRGRIDSHAEDSHLEILELVSRRTAPQPVPRTGFSREWPCLLGADLYRRKHPYLVAVS